MNKKQQIIFIGSMLFGLFFGAGNLIFPVFLGQQAGTQFAPATIGFILTAAGIPLLAVVAFAASKTDGLYALSSKVNKKFAFWMTLLVYLTIGPFFALPRTATVAFEVAFGPYLTGGLKQIALLTYTIIFFGGALFFALRSSKLLIWVGKILNPLFLLCLGLLILQVFLKPMGLSPGETTNTLYASQPFMKGFTEGYQTMDALAGLAFGSIIIETIKSLGITKSKAISKITIQSGLISCFGMIVIYASLSWMGATSLHIMPESPNGGIALAEISRHYFGNLGSIFLALLVTIACFKTAIGLITACSETCAVLFPKKHWKYVTVASCLTLFTICIANFGLQQIITLAVPVLMFLYPIAICLIFLGVADPLIHPYKEIYTFTIFITSIIGIIDGVNALPPNITTLPIISHLLSLAKTYIPFFSIGLGWLIPIIIAAIAGYIVARSKTSKQQ